MTGTQRPNDRRETIQIDVDRSAVFSAFAEAERDERVAAVYRRLAAVEAAHAEIRARLGGVDPKQVTPRLRARLIAAAARRIGPAAMAPVLSASGLAPSPIADGVDEKSASGADLDALRHTWAVQSAAGSVGGLSGQTLAQLEGRHRGGGGNALRAAVLGANDGLVSNLSLVMGVAGASIASHTILLTGLAGLVAGSCSMAMGEWLSVSSSREMHQRQIDQEAAALRDAPDLERAELTLIYQSKGLDPESAAAVADKVFESHDAALDALAREELGVDPAELGGSAWAAALSSFALFAAGAFFPVAPFLFSQGEPAVVASIVVSGLALGAIGLVTSRFTGRGPAFSVARQLAIGYVAALVTFGVGRLIGVTLAG